MTTLLRPGAMAGNLATTARTLTGSPVVADATVLDDITFPPSAGVDCSGWRTILLTASTDINYTALIRAGGQWVTGDAEPFNGYRSFVVHVMGRLFMPRVDDVGAVVTSLTLTVAGWEPLRAADGGSRG